MSDFDPDTERATEVEDYTGEVPRVRPAAPADPAGFGDGDIADVDDADVGQSNLDDELAELAGEIDVLAVLAERDQFKDLAMRVQADFENYRKRATAQATADTDRAAGRIAEALLPVLDAAESAYLAHPDEVGPLLNLMLAELRKHGLETLDLVDQPFDPEVAEAVAHQPGDGGDVVVAEVLRSGYTWRGRTLRAAMVRTKD
ncbi:MAG TPA: nucleotide exchange factor GrpE [Ilumatobacter sp.]|nr:nucleotide exchange factor GrpE [Ilumatobacter sp.]